MTEEGPRPGYGRNWKKYLAWYLVFGAAAYLIIYLIFFADGLYN
jgi:hypothetical protein